MTAEDLLTVQEFADHIRVHVGSIYRRIREGRQPGVYRFGRDLRIDRSTALLPASDPKTGSRSPEPGLGGLYRRV
jgi:excisionase family DNA binding protein